MIVEYAVFPKFSRGSAEKKFDIGLRDAVSAGGDLSRERAEDENWADGGTAHPPPLSSHCFGRRQLG